MSNERPSPVVPICLMVGALLGSGGVLLHQRRRALAWGVDGTALVVAAALLAVHFLRRGQDTLAAGFLVFIAGEALVVSSSAMSLEASSPSFAAGAALWAAALLLISAPRVMPHGECARIHHSVSLRGHGVGGFCRPCSQPAVPSPSVLRLSVFRTHAFWLGLVVPPPGAIMMDPKKQFENFP